MANGQANPIQIVPTVTAADRDEYRQFFDRARGLSDRVHLDFSDGEFAPSRTISLAQAEWDRETEIDLHLMYDNPLASFEQCISMAPRRVIVHAESATAGKFIARASEQFGPLGIGTGLALLGKTAPAGVADLIAQVEHVLIFTGKLGYYGGALAAENLAKIAAVRQLNPGVEIAVDGGINADNAAAVVKAGADVLDVGGYLQKAAHPQEAYAKLEREVQKTQTR